jgi:hypothetical protein
MTEELIRLHKKGLTDSQIATELRKLGYQTYYYKVNVMRQALKLPENKPNPNYTKGFTPTKCWDCKNFYQCPFHIRQDLFDKEKLQKIKRAFVKKYNVDLVITKIRQPKGQITKGILINSCDKFEKDARSA